MMRRIVIVIVAVACIGVVGFFCLAWRPAIAPIKPPNASTFSAGAISRGEVLAAVGHCASCHTRPGGEPFAGGYGVNTPFGIIYGTNITPEPNTGIGSWSLAAFTRAMREGVSRDGSHLFAAFPYNAFTGLANDDVNALYAYFMTRPAVRATVPRNTIPFPLNIRALEEGWKILFFRDRRFRADSAKSAEWNRGAYLAEALADCGGCHTPRNALGGEKIRSAYAGAVVDNWLAPPLTDANPSPLPWAQDELIGYLRKGVDPLHGAATAATMTPVIRGALDASVVPDSDIRAIAVYFSDIDHANAHEHDREVVVRHALDSSSQDSGQEYDTDAALYAAACLSCHYNSGTVPLPSRPELALNSALTLPEPTDFIQAVLSGIGSTEGAPGLAMPSYASLTDSEVANIGAYLRRTRTTRPPWAALEQKVSAVRRKLAPSH